MKLFLDENGMLGLVPKEIKAGDMICHSIDSNDIAIIRHEGVHFKLITKATKSNIFPVDSSKLYTSPLPLWHQRGADFESERIPLEHLDPFLECYLDFVKLDS